MAEPSASRPRLANLDGLRAFSVVLVILFHAQFLGVRGGFIGVSVFFTISGYLLTDRLLSRPLDGRAIGFYWQGRLRRILPSAWIVLLAIVVYESIDGLVPLHPTRRVLMTAFGAANWLQLGKTGGYAALFDSADAMVHYWSLAIEQQVYLVLPLLLWLLTRGRAARWQLPSVCLVMAASFALPFLTSMSVARAYYGTDTRAGEILAGVALAIAHQQRVLLRRCTRREGTVIAVVALAGLVALAFTVGPGDQFVSHGLLPLVAALSAALVHAAVSTRRLLRDLFERSIPRFIGTISYPMYLTHWPIIIALQPHDLPAWMMFAAAFGGSIALGWPLASWLERPLRRRGGSRLLWPAWVCVTAGALMFAAISLQPERSVSFVASLEELAAQPPPTNAVPPVNTAPTKIPVPAVEIYGDSIALTLGMILTPDDQHPPFVSLHGSIQLGCGVVWKLQGTPCAEVGAKWAAALARGAPDMVLVVSCQWELVPLQFPDGSTHLIGEPEADEAIRTGFREGIDQFLAAGTRIVALTLCPDMSQNVGEPRSESLRESRDPERMHHFNDIIRGVAAEYANTVVLVDLAGWMAPYIDDATIRPDGSHYEIKTPTALSEQLLDILEPALAVVRQHMLDHPR